MSTPYGNAAFLGDYPIAAEAEDSLRAAFLRRTYAHVAGAVVALVLVLFVLFETGLAVRWASTLFTGRWMWLLALLGFMVVSNVANRWAHSEASAGTQYLGLGLYVVAEALILAPLLVIAQFYFGGDLIGTAAVMTGLLFAVLTGVVFLTGKDFSFLKGALAIGTFAALGLWVASFFFAFTLGVVFLGLMIALSCGYMVYYTSNVLHHYRVTQHVAASLAIFSSVATLFFYIIQLLMALRRD